MVEVLVTFLGHLGAKLQILRGSKKEVCIFLLILSDS